MQSVSIFSRQSESFFKVNENTVELFEEIEHNGEPVEGDSLTVETRKVKRVAERSAKPVPTPAT